MKLLSAKYCYTQTHPTNGIVALMKNYLYFRGILFSELAVEQALYNHPDFPFISLGHLMEICQTWNLPLAALKADINYFSQMCFPAIAFIEKKGGSFVMIGGVHGNTIQYIDPAYGWIEEPLTDFQSYFKGVVLVAADPECTTLTGVGSTGIFPAPVARQKAAIVVTLINASKTLESFIRYHLLTGFEHIFLFFDNKEDESIAIAEKYEKVSIHIHDDCLHKQWSKGRLYNDLKTKLHFQEPRQLLNVELAVSLCLEKNIDYLLHLDIDELFYLPGMSVDEHFTSLAAEEIATVTYVNYEALSEQMEIDDYFQQITLFKKHKAHLSAEQQERVKAYKNLGVNVHFLAYNNGKSAARVDSALLPWGVHRFQYKKGGVSYVKKHKDYLGSMVLTNGVESKEARDVPAPLILHFAECGFQHFYRKYKTKGDFPDTFLGGQKIIDHIPFQLLARDTIKKEDIALARKFYQTEVLVEDKSLIHQMLKEGLLASIDFPSQLLGKT